MPAPLTYSGVHIEVGTSGARTITGVATSIIAFFGRSLKSTVNQPVRIQSFTDYDRIFGGL
jgi:phage tail sheath protein FI